MKFRFIIILIFSFISIFLVSDLIKVANSYEISLGYFLFVVPVNAILIVISFIAKREDIGWEKKIAVLGIVVAFVSLLLGGLTTAYRLISYYL